MRTVLLRSERYKLGKTREETNDSSVTAKASPSLCRFLLLDVPFKSFQSEASDLGHFAPAWTIRCGRFHAGGITLDRAVSLDQWQRLGT